MYFRSWSQEESRRRAGIISSPIYFEKNTNLVVYFSGSYRQTAESPVKRTHFVGTKCRYNRLRSNRMEET